MEMEIELALEVSIFDTVLLNSDASGSGGILGVNPIYQRCVLTQI